MKPSVLTACLAVALQIPAAEPLAPSSYYDLLVRWQTRPTAEIQADADRGDAVAQYYLGTLLMAGRGVACEPERGLALIRQAVAQGNADAMTELARCHFLGQGVPENAAEALRLAREAAARSNAAGLNLLGVFVARGLGQPANPAEAVRLYRQAAAAGNPTAMRNLGGATLDGIGGLARDAAAANGWFLRAGERGHTGGMVAYGYSLLHGRGITTDSEAGFKWLLRAAASGDADGLREMAGHPDHDPRAVVDGWHQAARRGDAGVKYHLARLIISGETTSRSPDETPQRLLQAAAEADHVEAALMLGDRFRWGYGGPQDLVSAARWYLLGSSRDLLILGTTSQDPGHRGALDAWFDGSGNLRLRKTPEDRALAAALGLYSRAMWRRDPEAMREIARHYQSGLNVPVDLMEAAAWLLLAQQCGSAPAGTEAQAALKPLTAAQQELSRDRVRHLLHRPAPPGGSTPASPPRGRSIKPA